MGRGQGYGTATAIEWLNTGTWYLRPVVKYGSYPKGGAVMTAEGKRRGGGRFRKRCGRGLSYVITKSQYWGMAEGGRCKVRARGRG